MEVAEIRNEGDENPNGLKLVVHRDGQVVEEHPGVTTSRGKSNVAALVNAASKTVKLEQISGKPTEELHAGMQVALAAPSAVAVASAPARLTGDDYVGDVADRTGFAGLEAIDEITMVCVPDLMARLPAGRHRPGDRQGGAAGDDRPLRADGRPHRDPRPAAGPQRAADQGVAGRQGRLRLEVRRAVLAVDQGLGPGHRPNIVHAAVRPHGRHLGPQRRHPRRAQGTGQRGRARARSRLEIQITKNEHDLLNPVGINCIRSFPGRGIRVWGARTLSSRPGVALPQRPPAVQLPRGVDPERHQLGGLRAERPRAVGQDPPHDQPRSWSASGARARCSALTPDEAFFVKCDGETNPAEGIDAGQVVCEIGVAPVKPAEFVIFRLSQFSGGASLVSRVIQHRPRRQER